MDENLVGYLLNSLDKGTRGQVDAYLKSSPQARERLELMRQALAPLAEDRGDPSAPPSLVIKTLARVAEHCGREMPRAPTPAPRQAPSHRPMWRRADLVVAASLLVAVLSLGAPAIAQLRNHHAKIACQNNLKEFFYALNTYYGQHGQLPNFAAQRQNMAGVMAPLLNDAGVLPQTASIRCPANGPGVPCTMTMEQIKSLNPEGLKAQARKLIPCYAYSLGYLDEEGVYHFPNHSKDLPLSLVPLMADRPPDVKGNSPNHGGEGQNVLFHDGHVRFATLRTVGINGDDIYINKHFQVAAGVDRLDTVLGHSSARPFEPTP